MRVGFLIDRWTPSRGGAESALAELAAHLGSDGHDVHAFGLESAAGAPGTFHRIQVRGLTRGSRERALGESAIEAARATGCDVTIGIRHLARVDLLWMHGGSHAASRRAVVESRRGVVLASDPPLRGRHRVFAQLEQQALEGGARLVVAPSELTHGELVARYPRASERIVVAPNGVDLERFHPRERDRARRRLREVLELPERLPLLVLPARNPVLKGVAALLAALGRLGERGLALLVAGGTPRRPCRLPAGQTVIYRESLDPVLLAAGADISVQPTWRDPCPLATLEALAAGTPVVTTRRNGAVESDTAGAAVSWVDDPTDVEGLAAHVRARLDGAAPTPEKVRAAVENRGRLTWLARMSTLVERAAP